MSSADYADDPMKALSRHLDAEIVARGGQSIFACRPAGSLRPERAEALDRWFKSDRPIVSDLRRRTVAEGRPPNAPKHGRIMGHTFGILGGGSISDFDDM